MKLTYKVTVTVGETGEAYDDPQVVREIIEELLEDDFDAVEVERIKEGK